MTDFVIKENSGSLFRNRGNNPKAPVFKLDINIDGKVTNIVIFENKSDNPKAPPFTGTLTSDGKQKRVAVWEGTTKNGEGYHSFLLSEPMAKPKEEVKEEKKEKYVSQEKLDEEGFDDSIPF